MEKKFVIYLNVSINKSSAADCPIASPLLETTPPVNPIQSILQRNQFDINF